MTKENTIKSNKKSQNTLKKTHATLKKNPKKAIAKYYCFSP
jgi:hypothetical protein